MLSVDWPTQIINIPKDYTQLVEAPTPPLFSEVRDLDLDVLYKDLQLLEATVPGRPFPITNERFPPVDTGDLQLAPVVLIINGYMCLFEPGNYSVILRGANTNLHRNTISNGVGVWPTNSAGLTYSKQVEDLSYGDGRVWVDELQGLPGQAYPRGTTSDPVNNLVDALAIVANRGLPKQLHLTGTFVVTPSEDISDYDICGKSSIHASLDVQTGANTQGLILADLTITGDLNGEVFASRSVSFATITDFDGKMVECGLRGVIDLGIGGTMHEFIDCYSEEVGDTRPIIDANSLNNLELSMRRYSGGIELRNWNQPNNYASFDLALGKLVIDASCTDGTILVRGLGQVVDNSGPGCTVDRSGLDDTDLGLLSHKILRNRFETNPSTGIATVYDDDDTPLLTGQLYEDVGAGQTYRGQGANRRERLT